MKSTGPKTAAGKRRSALNAFFQTACAQEVEEELRVRGEDPREFRRLHLDLVAIFQPDDKAASQAIELLAITWWKKARRIRQWIGVGPAQCDDLDGELEALLVLAVNTLRRRGLHWGVRLASVLGRPIGSPANVRSRIEQRLFLFGAKPGRRKYPRGSRSADRFGGGSDEISPGTAAVDRESQPVSRFGGRR